MPWRFHTFIAVAASGVWRKGTNHASEDCRAQREAREMRRMHQFPPRPALPRHREHQRVEKNEMQRRPLHETGHAEKNPRHRPRQPRRTPLCPPRHPGRQRHAGKRNIDPLNLRTREPRLRQQPKLVVAMIAATSAVSASIQPHPLPSAISVSPSASTQSAEGRRAVHSLRTPVSANEPAIIQLTNGGLRRNGLPPTYGTNHFPVFNIVTAGKIRRPSSPFNSVEPSPGKYTHAQTARKIRAARSRVIARISHAAARAGKQILLACALATTSHAEDAPPFKAKATRVLLCVWDGMRPDFITAENTPNLYALAQRGTFFNNNHAVYISTTEVNGTVLATGVFPRRSGIMGNREYRPGVDLMNSLAMEDHKTITIDDALTDGRHIAVPTVAELVQKAGRTTALASTKAVGLLHDRGEDRTGRSPTIWIGHTYPKDFLKTIEQAQGKFPNFPQTDIVSLDDAKPNTAQNLWTTRAFVDFLWKGEVPTYSVLWLGDPDFSQHLTAPGAPTALAAIHDSDTHLGIVLAELEKRGLRDSTDVLVVSDHGFSTVDRALDLGELFAKRGFTTYRDFKTTPKPDDILLANVGGTTCVYVIGSDPKIVTRLVEMVQSTDIAGPIFTRDGLPGTFTSQAWPHGHRGAARHRLLLPLAR